MHQVKRLNFLHSEINGVFHGAAVKLGLSDSALYILYTICNIGSPCPLASIIQMTGISKQTIHSALQKLEGEGLLYLQTLTGRKKAVCLTEAGKALAEKTAGKLLQIENEIYESWTQEERDLYLELTQRYLQQLRTRFQEV